MVYNKSPISLREGHVFLNGVEVMDSIKCTILASPDVWKGRNLGEKTPSSRWLGIAYSGTITRRRSTKWLEAALKEYQDTGETPEFTIQGIADDKNSDFYKQYGESVVTAVGVILTGDLHLFDLDSEGQVVEDNIGFNAKDVIL